MMCRLHISRDLRTGAPLDIPRDALRYEHPDIPLDVEVRRYDDDWEITARVAGDVPRIDAEGNAVAGFLFRNDERIELTADEEADAIEDYSRSQMGIYD